ncbi:MAG: hypothetical protein WD793_05850 [Steroidobacteraceae bacterium]
MILLRAIVRWLATRAVWFVAIVILLAAGMYLVGEFRQFDAEAARLSEMQQKKQILERITDAETARVTRDIADLSGAPIRVLNARLVELDRRISSFPERSVLEAVSAPVDELSDRVRLELLKQQRDYVENLLLIAQATAGLKAANERLDRLRKDHRAKYERLRANERQQEKLTEAFPVAVYVPGSESWRNLRRLKAEHETLFERNQSAGQAARKQAQRIARLGQPGPLAPFAVDRGPIQRYSDALDRQIAPLEEWQRRHWLARILQPIRDVIPWALGILVSIILVPPLIKTFLYFVLAPIAAGRPPIRLLTARPAAEITFDEVSTSGISRAVAIDDTHELLVHPEFLQSSSLDSPKDTKWLLDWQYPITSLASGLFALTRIRTAAPATVVISDKKDPLNEVGQIVVPTGIALAFQPSNLVGLIQLRGQPVMITRHWRLGSLTAWLTFQLRYLVFHGPATLLVKGCRGIRIEQAGSGRSIDQSATIGFCAHLAHAVARCETFPPYLFGNHSLFDDKFSGGPGFYVYEEVSDLGRKSRIAGRGVEGVMDSLLRIFGI